MMTSAQVVETSVSDHYLQNCLNKILLLSPKTVFHSYTLHSYSHVFFFFFSAPRPCCNSWLARSTLEFCRICHRRAHPRHEDYWSFLLKGSFVVVCLFFGPFFIFLANTILKRLYCAPCSYTRMVSDMLL